MSTEKMACYKLTYDYQPTLFLQEQGEKIDTVKWAVWSEVSTTFSDGEVKVLTQGGTGNLIISFIESDQAKYAGKEWNYYRATGIVDALSYAEKYSAANGLVNLVLLSHASGGNLVLGSDVLSARDFSNGSLGEAFLDLIDVVNSAGRVAIIGCNAGLGVGPAIANGLDANGPDVYINSSTTPGMISDIRNGQLIYNVPMNSYLGGSWTNATTGASYGGMMITTLGSISPRH